MSEGNDPPNLRYRLPILELSPGRQRFGAFVSGAAYENCSQQIEQPICADREQGGANRNECFSGHCLPPQREETDGGSICRG